MPMKEMIRKIQKTVFGLLFLLASGAALADDVASPGIRDLLPELLLRPMGFVGLVGGCALFAAATPFTLAASLEEPHDAWSNSFNGFVGAPIRYTFLRPIGDYRFEVNPD
ncbi:MAG: hypothetical protein ACRERS_00920 [Methylococcales bacterium]